MQYIRIKCIVDHRNLSNLKSLLYVKNLNTLNAFCKKYIFQSLLAIYDIQVYGVLKYISIHHQSTNCISLCYIHFNCINNKQYVVNTKPETYYSAISNPLPISQGIHAYDFKTILTLNR